MQNRYAGDIGDYIKYTLLRRLSVGKRLGLAWYLFPDQAGTGDGRHTKYLGRPARWRGLDPCVFDAMKRIVSGERSVAAVEAAGLLPSAVFAGDPLHTNLHGQDRRDWRSAWFRGTLASLRGCDIVFADPDNGLCKDERFSAGARDDWKRLPVAEALELAEGRTAIFYHHNTRARGGHEKEIEEWMGLLGCRAALRWRRVSSRTFFIVNPDREVEDRLRTFADDLCRFEAEAEMDPKSEVIWSDKP